MGKQKKKLSRKERLQTIRSKQEKELLIKKAFEHSKKIKKEGKLLTTINQLYTKEIGYKELYRTPAIHLVRMFNKKAEINREMHRVLSHLCTKQCQKMILEEELVRGIYNIVAAHIKNHHPYIQDPNTWKPKNKNPWKQFEDFANHCFTRYPVPAFLHKTLFDSDFLEYRWFIKCGKGISIRKLDKMPINLSKKMAHSFYEIPATLCWQEGIRWAQIKGLGGSADLAYRMIKTRISRNEFQQEKFWEKALIWFVNNEKAIVGKENELVDYLMVKSQESEHFSLSSRKATDVLRKCQEWHTQMSFNKKKGWFAWAKSGIREFSIEDELYGSPVTYFIKELLCSKELFKETQMMRHCVQTYEDSCQNKSSAIFSLRVRFGNGREKILATLEVSPKEKEIVQAKAKCNEDISKTADTLMRLWAETEGLKVYEYL